MASHQTIKLANQHIIISQNYNNDGDEVSPGE
jgi:hypothetical protein